MDKQQDEKLLKRDARARVALLIATCALVVALMSPKLSGDSENLNYRAGDVATSTVTASRDFDVEDTANIAALRSAAESSVPRVYSLDDREESRPATRVDQLLLMIEEENEGEVDPELFIDQVLDRFGIELSVEEVDILRQSDTWPEIRATVARLTDPIVDRGILATKRPLLSASEKHGVVLQRKSNNTEQLMTSPADIYSLDEARELLENSVPGTGYGKGRSFDSLLYRLSRNFLRPNVTFDNAVTEQRIDDARNKVQPTFIHVERGEIVVRSGETISSLQERKLQALNGFRSRPVGARLFFSYVAILAILTTVLFRFFSQFWPNFRPSTRDLSLQAALLIGTLILLKLWIIAGDVFALRYAGVGSDALMLATPLALGGILLQATVGAPAVAFFMIILTMVCGILLQDSWLLLLLVMVGSAAGALSVREAPRRSIFLIAALRVAAVNLLFTIGFVSVSLPFDYRSSLVQGVAALCGGLLSGVLAAALAPAVEFVGGYISDMKLLELASLDRPLLRDLSVQAPGTWNHSTVMGQLGESAAEAIGANSLLVRVGAYYHDIGKMKKPAYFVENQNTRDSRHDKLSPTMSALIIRAHVKDGLELAAEHKLPQAIVDFIPEHHGTNRIEFFYEKARKEAGPDGEMDDSLFRYTGPKPQTKESGILMLADSVEACSRVLPDPTPARIQGMVQKIVNKTFASGQLEETDLTLRDLHLIANRFTRVLSGIFHKRIEYSEPVEKQTRQSDTEASKRDANRDDRPEPPQEGAEGAALSENKANTGEALRRLGIERERVESSSH